MMVVAAGDHLTVSDEALAAWARALEPKKLVLLPGGHFDAYVKDFEPRQAVRRWTGSSSTSSRSSAEDGGEMVPPAVRFGPLATPAVNRD
jgi:hypothetical protein